MAKEIIISVEKISKEYRLGQIGSTTLRESFERWRRRVSSSSAEDPGILRALSEVSFEVRRGEVLGIIGRNGAGKSTLLKILSRITQPTSGRAVLRGRVASLLEVGTGFHPELTGRENIYLNGAILGMKKLEIKSRFDEIVAFAEVERFIDTPVKRYSSGMYVRLAFAVAAHLDPEILIVDEVLAVGDAGFQKKCLGKMTEVAKGGRTILFVSHNMGAVQNLCQRAIWLKDGQVRYDGTSGETVNSYLASLRDADAALVAESRSGNLKIEKVVTLNSSGEPTASFRTGDQLIIDLHYNATEPVQRPNFWISFESQFGPMFGANMILDGRRPETISGRGRIRCVVNELPLLPHQQYTVIMGVREGDGLTTLIPYCDVAAISIVGRPVDLGLTGEQAETVVAGSSPLTVPYRWELPDGSTATVDPLAVIRAGRGG